MRLLRTLPTSRLLVLVGAFVVVAAAAAAIALGAGGSGPTPPAKPLDQAIHDALAAPEVPGVTARIAFTNNLFPSGALLGSAGSALMSGASGRLWATADGRGRLELQSDAGDVQVVWNPTAVTVFDASSNTVYRATLPARTDTGAKDTGAPPALAEIDSFLAKLGAHVALTGAEPTSVGDQPAYAVSGSPRENGGLLGSLRLAWDAARGVPLRVGVYAKGATSPVLALAVKHISYGPVASGDVDISPPAGARVVDLGKAAHDAGSHSAANGPDATGLAAVEAAAGFPVSAPAKLAGRARSDVRLAGSADSPAVVVVYGEGLGSIAVVERKADAAAAKGDPLASLPTVSLGGVPAHELTTQLGTALEWRNGGVETILAGSVSQATAEAAARGL